MEFIDHDAGETAEHRTGLRIGEHQCQRLRRRQQDVRWLAALPVSLMRWRVAGPRLDTNVESCLGDRTFQISVDIHRPRLQWRDVEGVQPVSRCRLDRKSTRLKYSHSC